MNNTQERVGTEAEWKLRVARDLARHAHARPTLEPLDEFADLRRILQQTQSVKVQHLKPRNADRIVQRAIRYATWTWKVFFVYWGWTAVMAAILLLLGNSLLSTAVSVGLFAIVVLFHIVVHEIFSAFLGLGFGILGDGAKTEKLTGLDL